MLLVWIFWVLLDGGCGDRLHIIASLGKRESGLEPGENFVAMIAAIIGREIRRHEDLRRPQVGRRWVIKALWHDADHLAGSAVNGDIFADYLGVGAKDALRQLIAEDDNAIVALFPFIGRKRAAEVRVYAEEGEKTRRNGCTVEAPRTAADTEILRSL